MSVQEKRQEMFDKAWEVFVVQKRKRAVKFGSCAYRSLEGPCIIGMYIPDREYSERMEGRTVKVLLEENSSPSLKKLSIEVDDLFGDRFLLDIQRCHDWFDNPEGIENALREFSKKYNLLIPGESNNP